MNTSQEHLTFESLNDLVDGRLDKRAADLANSHLAQCRSCAMEHDSLKSVLQSARELPLSVSPEEDFWPDVREILNSRKTLVLPNSGGDTSGATAASGGHRVSPRFGALLAAAAVVLIVLSSWITTLVLRRDHRDAMAIAPRVAPQVDIARVMLPPNFRLAEQEYSRTIEELQIAVNTQRNQLSPETVRTVDRSLAVVDSAIAEARSALLADPNNRMLVDLLSATYQRKLDLLRRTSELGSKI